MLGLRSFDRRPRVPVKPHCLGLPADLHLLGGDTQDVCIGVGVPEDLTFWLSENSSL